MVPAVAHAVQRGCFESHCQMSELRIIMEFMEIAVGVARRHLPLFSCSYILHTLRGIAAIVAVQMGLARRRRCRSPSACAFPCSSLVRQGRAQAAVAETASGGVVDWRPWKEPIGAMRVQASWSVLRAGSGAYSVPTGTCPRWGRAWISELVVVHDEERLFQPSTLCSHALPVFGRLTPV